MAPEQLSGERQQIDRRSDVYAAGVVLYELLTGAPPFAGDAQLIAWRVVHEDVRPPRASNASLPHDLETIVMTCLQKEARHRYQSAQALADDLGRFLAGEPILARRESTLLRARRFARRHWAAIGIAMLLLLSGSGLLGVTIREQQKADRRARLAQWLGREVELNDMFLRMAYALPLHDVRQEEAVVRARIAAIDKQLADMPPSEISLAHYAIGRSLLMLREYDSAIAHLQTARATGNASVEVALTLGRALVARFQQAQSEFETWQRDEWVVEQLARQRKQYLPQARQLLESGQATQNRESLLDRALLALVRDEHASALALATTVFETEPWRSEAKKLIGDVHAALAWQRRQQGQYPQALEALMQAQRDYQSAMHMSRSDPAYILSSAKLCVNQLVLELYLGRSPLASYDRCLALSQELQQAQPESVEPRDIRLAAAQILIRYHSDRHEPIERYEAQVLADMAFLHKRPVSSLLTHRQALLYQYLIEARLSQGLPLGELPALAEAEAARVAASPEIPARGYQVLGDLALLLSYKSDIEGRSIIKLVNESLESYRKGISISPRDVIAYEGSLLAYRRAVFPLAVRDELPERWVTEAEGVAQLGLAISRAPFVFHQLLAGVYLDSAEVLLLDGRDQEAAGLLDKAQPHIEKALSLLPTNAPGHADSSSLYRLRALRALRFARPFEDVQDLLVAAEAAMERSLALNPRDPPVLLAHAKLLLLSAEQALRTQRESKELLVRFSQTIAQIPRAGWYGAVIPFLEYEATLLRMRSIPAGKGAPLIEQARASLLQSLRQRPQWRLAQRRLSELSAGPPR